MSTVYASNHSDADIAPKGKKSKKKIIVISAVVGTFLIPAAAWAAVSIFGFGSFSSTAAAATELTIVGNPTLTNTLAPGQTVGVKGVVRNTADYPIKVTGIIVKKGSEVVTGGTPTECKVSLGSAGTTAEFPAHGSAAAVPNSTKFTLAAPVTVPAGGDVLVTVPGVVTQASDATKLCGISADYAVTGIVGS